MKKVMLSAVVVSGLLFSAFTGTSVTADNAAVTTEFAPVKGKSYKLQSTQSTVNWTGKKVTGEHTGTIKVTKGDVIVNKNTVTGGSFEIDMNSITCTDIKDAEYNKKLVGHLRSDDFFSVDKHPKANFVITKVSPIKGAKAGENNYNVTGNLTIKGITNAIEFPAKIQVNNGVATASADVVVNRAKYDIRYGSGSFFEGLGDKMIYDDMYISFKVVAKQ